MTLSVLEQLLWGVSLVSTMMLGLWLYQLRSRDAGIVDLGWSAGLGLLALFYALTSPGYAPRQWLVVLLAGVWSFRLALHLYLRNRGRGEDGRYRALRESWGSQVQPFFLVFFQAQALLDVILSLSFLVAIRQASGWGTGDVLGVLIWLVAVAGEFSADRQLERFRSDPANRGKTCRQGLWRYSRHPNYFFEWLHWWSYVALAWGTAYWWLTLSAPALMLFFLFKITGIPATEEQALRSRGEDYRRYQRSTSAFVPWFLKEDRR